MIFWYATRNFIIFSSAYIKKGLIGLTYYQGEDYLVENFSATSGGKFSESTKNQIFGANMCKTLI